MRGRKDGVPNNGVPGVGYVRGPRTQIVVRVDRMQFDEIRDRAVKEGTSIAEQVRNLIEWGLEAGE